MDIRIYTELQFIAVYPETLKEPVSFFDLNGVAIPLQEFFKRVPLSVILASKKFEEMKSSEFPFRNHGGHHSGNDLYDFVYPK